MAKINVQPKILEIPTVSLNPWLENPREIAGEALEGLRSSLEKFGYIDLIVVNKRNMQVISGHQRLLVLQGADIEAKWETFEQILDSVHEWRYKSQSENAVGVFVLCVKPGRVSSAESEMPAKPEDTPQRSQNFTRPFCLGGNMRKPLTDRTRLSPRSGSVLDLADDVEMQLYPLEMIHEHLMSLVMDAGENDRKLLLSFDELNCLCCSVFAVLINIRRTIS